MHVVSISRTFVKLSVFVFFTGQLITACGGGDSSSNTDNNGVVIANTAPVADAGDDQSVTTGTEVTLDASNSSDADGDSLSYSWTFSSIPAGSGVTLTNS
ncbi:MAG: hypothetical protein GY829_06330, partial [Gammaproteobacteria bacterium]|nr:hypothetical protein [Gammaproteobacteria bacterium]